MCEKLFSKASNIYSFLFHFFQLFVVRDQIRGKTCHFLQNYSVSFLLINFAVVHVHYKSIKLIQSFKC